MMNKMSSITFPDGSNYEITDDKARKDITEINNDIDNVQGAIDGIQTQLDSKADKTDLRLMEVHGSNTEGKPWINLKGQWSKIPNGMTCVEIVSGGRFGCLVWKMNENYGKAIIFSYWGETKNLHVSISGGNWKYSWTTQETETTF